jgi:hypothetical protein
VPEPSDREQVRHGGTALLVATPAPHGPSRLVQQCRMRQRIPARATRDRVRESQGLGVEVDVVPGGQGATPVEDDCFDVVTRHGLSLPRSRPPARGCPERYLPRDQAR